MPRTVLMHLNVEVPDDDGRSVPELIDALEGAIEVGSDHPGLNDLVIEVVMAEIVYGGEPQEQFKPHSSQFSPEVEEFLDAVEPTLGGD